MYAPDDDIFELEMTEGILSDIATVSAATAAGGPMGAITSIGAIASKNMGKIAIGAVASAVVNDVLSKVPQTILDMAKPDSAALAGSDTNSTNNKFRTRPQGVMICDTINNPIFPIPYPPLDSVKFNLPDVKDQYQGIYSQLPVDFLPWHYLIEMINGKYYAFQTRPLDMMYPVDTKTAQELINKNGIKLKPEVEKFFLEQPFDLKEAIHVCILGDTNRDVYLERLYELIGRLCTGPFLRYFKLPHRTGMRVIDFNLGHKFRFSKLDMHLSR